MRQEAAALKIYTADLLGKFGAVQGSGSLPGILHGIMLAAYRLNGLMLFFERTQNLEKPKKNGNATPKYFANKLLS
jgi:hypothetical protein